MSHPELLRLRDSIDNIDAALIHLLAERFKCTQAVGEYKATHDLPPADPSATRVFGSQNFPPCRLYSSVTAASSACIGKIIGFTHTRTSLPVRYWGRDQNAALAFFSPARKAGPSRAATSSCGVSQAGMASWPKDR